MRSLILYTNLVLLCGCMSAGVSGTNVKTIWGSADTINGEVAINAVK